MNKEFNELINVVDRTDSGTDAPLPSAHAKTDFFDALTNSVDSINVVSHWAETSGNEPTIVIGKTTDPIIEKLLSESTRIPESIVIEWVPHPENPLFVIAGTDERGLAYALYEITERIETNDLTALTAIDAIIEEPDNRVRGVDKFIMGPIIDEWAFSIDFWEYYLKRLARNRFNRFVLVTGYDTAYLSPPYPFIVAVDDYPDIQITTDQPVPTRSEHREILSTIGELCEEYGLEFYLGIWQQRPDWRESQGAVVSGLPDEPSDFADYCARGLEELLVEIPAIDGLQLRINYEAGVGGSTYDSGSGIGPSTTTAEDFWRKIITAVEQASDVRDSEVKLDLRAKGLTDELLTHAFQTGLDVTIPTKYWTESTGLPYHLTQMRREELDQLYDLNRKRRYGYSDLLAKPRYHDIIYRLWVVGTNRIFLWGDPEYARRFATSTQFGDASGFEVTAPLGLKGGHMLLQSDSWSLFDDTALRDYDWEDERYWAWYRLFGRLGYSPDTSLDFWHRSLENRYDKAATAIDTGYRSASKILPLLTAVHLTEHPALQNWAELDTGGALFAENNINPKFGNTEYYDGTYQDVEPSDPGLFYGIREYIEDYTAGALDDKYTPVQIQQWFRELATETRDAVASIKSELDNPSGESKSMILDFEMLADLADYHAEKTNASLALSLYQEDSRPEMLITARDHMEAAITHWESLANKGSGTYHEDLVFGLGEESAHAGQWSNRLPELEKDIAKLEDKLHNSSIDPDTPASSLQQEFVTPKTTHRSTEVEIPPSWPQHTDLPVVIHIGGPVSPQSVKIHYRITDLTAGEFKTHEMKNTNEGYRFEIPAAELDATWDMQVYCTVTDQHGEVLIIPGVFTASEDAPYFIVSILDK